MSQEFVDKVVAFIKGNGWPIALDCPMIVYIENCDQFGTPLVPQLDKFDDRGLLIDPVNNRLILNHQATTMYGKEALKEQIPRGGAARICLGYHEDAWMMGFHKRDQTHPALVQVKAVDIQRDLNGDGERSGDVLTSELVGLNQHTTGKVAPALIGPWSYGCTVRRYRSSHMQFIRELRKSERFIKDKRCRFSSYYININQL
jgi:hypothetical protein